MKTAIRTITYANTCKTRQFGCVWRKCNNVSKREVRELCEREDLEWRETRAAKHPATDDLRESFMKWV